MPVTVQDIYEVIQARFRRFSTKYRDGLIAKGAMWDDIVNADRFLVECAKGILFDLPNGNAVIGGGGQVIQRSPIGPTEDWRGGLAACAISALYENNLRCMPSTPQVEAITVPPLGSEYPEIPRGYVRIVDSNHVLRRYIDFIAAPGQEQWTPIMGMHGDSARQNGGLVYIRPACLPAEQLLELSGSMLILEGDYISGTRQHTDMPNLRTSARVSGHDRFICNQPWDSACLTKRYFRPITQEQQNVREESSVCTTASGNPDLGEVQF